MKELSIGVSIYCNPETKVILKVLDDCRFVLLSNCQLGNVTILLNEGVAKELHAALEQLYPELATSNTVPEEVVVRYAEEFATEETAKPTTN